jgi:hypothetical protein
MVCFPVHRFGLLFVPCQYYLTHFKIMQNFISLCAFVVLPLDDYGQSQEAKKRHQYR